MTRTVESLVIVALAFYIIINSSENIEITVEQGKLKGKVFESRNGTKYYGFLGIPYAKPPVGDLRFEVRKIKILFLLMQKWKRTRSS